MSWDEWFRRRSRQRFPFFDLDMFGFPFSFMSGDVEELMREMERRMEQMLREFEDRIPKELVRERRLPQGGTLREVGPFVYGFSMTFGADGKPVIKEFGNLRPTRRAKPWEPPFDLKEEREPLVDVIEGDTDVRVIAELPGVEKEDIKLHATETSLTIDVAAKERRYHKELELPAEVDPKDAKSTYRNGILEVTLVKKVKERKPKGESIPID